MKSYMLKASVALFLFIITSCSAGFKPSPLPRYEFPPNTRVGIINMVEDDMTHVHVGTTVFNNFSKKYEVDFKFSQHVENELARNIQDNCQFEVEQIPPTPLLLEHKNRLIKVSKTEKRAIINPELASEFSLLANKYNADVFFIMRTYRMQDFIADSVEYLEGYGLYTRSILGLSGAFAYANLIIQGVYTHPPTFIGGEDFNYKDENRGIFVKIDFNLPDDLNNIPRKKLRKIDAILKERSKGVTYRILEKTHLLTCGN